VFVVLVGAQDIRRYHCHRSEDPKGPGAADRLFRPLSPRTCTHIGGAVQQAGLLR
jgi:hypothetical protein